MSNLPPDFLVLSDVDNAAAMIGPLFERKFGHALPEWPNDIVAFFKRDDGSLYPMSYAKFFPMGSVMLVGGCSTDGKAFGFMSDAQRAELSGLNSSMVHLLRYGFRRFADKCDAYFGYCGDPRAWEVDLAAGFVPTEHEKLLVHWHKPLNAQTQRALVAMAHALGPF